MHCVVFDTKSVWLHRNFDPSKVTTNWLDARVAVGVDIHLGVVGPITPGWTPKNLSDMLSRALVGISITSFLLAHC